MWWQVGTGGVFVCVCFFLVLLGKYEDACLVFHFGISASTFWWGRKLILVFFFPWRERKESTEPAYAYKALDYTHSTYLDCLKSSEVQGTIQRLKIGSFNINMFPISGCNPLQDTKTPMSLTSMRWAALVPLHWKSFNIYELRMFGRRSKFAGWLRWHGIQGSISMNLEAYETPHTHNTRLVWAISYQKSNQWLLVGRLLVWNPCMPWWKVITPFSSTIHGLRPRGQLDKLQVPNHQQLLQLDIPFSIPPSQAIEILFHRC